MRRSCARQSYRCCQWSMSSRVELAEKLSQHLTLNTGIDMLYEPYTLSAQLLVLSNAGLLRARREGRSIIYAIKFDAVRDLLVFLTEDCCAGRAEMCAPLAEIASRCCGTGKGEKHEAPARSRRRR